MQDSNKVTIVTLVYNVEKYFERCLRSIFEQDYKNIEFLIINNCSTDNSMTVLDRVMKDYPEREKQVAIQNNEKNMGYCYSINKGFELATGKYITFVDSDDWLEPGSISKCVGLMDDNNYDVLQFENYVDKYAGRFIRRNRVKEGASNIDCVNAMLASQLIMEGTFWTKFYRTEFVKKSGLTLLPNCPPWSDMCFNVRLFSLTKKIGILRKPLYHYCENETQTVKSWAKNRESSKLRISQEVKNLRQVEEHLANIGILNQCLESLNLRKYSFKNDNLLFLDNDSINDWCNTFPEINKFSISSPLLSIHERITNKLLLSGNLRAVKTLKLIRKILGSIKRKFIG